MLKLINLVIEKAVANQSGAMEADTISKHGRSSTSQKSRVNLLTSEKGGRHFTKNIILAILCFFTMQLYGQSIEQQLLSQLHQTSNTSANDANKWTKIASCTITAGYQDFAGEINFMGTGSAELFYYGRIIARFKNQNANAAPVNYFSLVLINSNIGSENVKAVRNNLQVDIYIRIPSTYTITYFWQSLKGHSGPLTMHNNQSFLTSLSGTIIDCTDHQIEQQLLNTLHQTSNTSGSDHNKWTKIAECNITAAWQDLGGNIEFSGTGSGSTTVYYGKIMARFKNSSANITAPNFTNLLLFDSNLGAENVKAVINGTNIAVYIRIPLQHTRVLFRQTLKSEYGALNPVSNQPFSNSLPSGTQINCVNGLNTLTDGRVGIGITQPAAGISLHVNGIIRATEVRVLAQGADYVFNDDYELRPLEEVEQFIKENRHLPDIPSAAQMEEDEVICIANMNRLLLQKIEELTLYVIELKKEINELKK